MNGSWHTMRITYYAPQDRLIAEAIGPVITQLRSWTDDVYFVRHWRQGPHIRLNVRCPDNVFNDVVATRVRAVVGEFLRLHPSTADVDVDRATRLHRRLAQEEQERGPLTPWMPDNSVEQADYDTRRHVLGTAEAEMFERFSVRTNDLAVWMTQAVVDGASRSRLSFDLLVATAHALSGHGLERGFVSLRSHSEAFLTYSPDGPALRGRWAREYRHRSVSLRRRLREVVAAVDSGDREAAPFVHPWIDELGNLKDATHRLVVDGRMTLSPLETGDKGRSAPAADPASDYHRWMTQTHQARAAVESSPWFLAYRWVLNCTYLHFTRIGLAPVDRYLLCTWVADAVEEEHAVDAFDVARRILEEAT